MRSHTPPIVPHVLYVADQHHPWQLAPIERLATRYHTPTTVALAFGTIDSTVKPQQGKSGATKQQYHVWCVPDDAAWQRVTRARADLQLAIDAFADELRRLGSYATRLAAAGGLKDAPNPLSPTVISASDPDSTDTSWWTANPIPRIDRSDVASHTPKMLHITRDGRPWSTTHQRNHFVCPDDAAWQAVQDYRALAEVAHTRWQKVLSELGTYQEALADGRYAGLAQSTQSTQSAPTPPAGDTWHNLPPALAGWRWATTAAGEMSLCAPDGWQTKSYTYSTKAIAEALRRVNSQPKAAPTALIPAAPAVTGVTMMDAAEARDTLNRMAGDLEQVDVSIASFRQKALDFAEREGWKALGYSGSAEAINAELGTQYSKSYLSRLLNAAKIERLLELPTGNQAPAVPERTLRPLGQLDTPQQQQAAWQQATAAAGGATPTSAQVQQAVQDMKPATDATHLAAIERILATLDQWSDAARPAQLQGAYSYARQLHDPALRTRAFAAIDRAVSGKAEPPPIPADLETRAGQLGLRVSVDDDGYYRSMNAKGAANYADHPTLADLEAFIARKEDAAQLTGVRGAPPAPAPEWNAIAKLTYHLGGTTDAAEAATAYRAIGMLLRASGVLPALPKRPRAPRSADISDQLQYLGQLEDYADALEAAVAAREQAVAA